MTQFDEQLTQELFEKNLITENQFQEIREYRSLNIFSLNVELKLLLSLAVLMFTTGIGVLIYENIDTIGHIAILSLLLIVIVICFYYCFKHSKGFQKTETTFDHPVIEYLVLTGNILTCIFIGYLQFQYKPFGEHYNLATLIPTMVSFFCAFYFDNKSVLTIAITGLAACIGLSVTPQDVFNDSNNFYANQSLSYSAFFLAVLLMFWTKYSTRNSFKAHFNIIFLTFSFHIISIASISNLLNEDSFTSTFFTGALIGSTYYFYKASYAYKAMSLYVFMIVYAYIGANIVLFRIFENIDFSDAWTLLILGLPAYFIVSIVMFIKLIKNFHKEITA